MTPLDRIIKARQLLVLDYFFFGNLVLKLKVIEDPTCRQRKGYLGWTDGKYLAFDPKFAAEETMPRLVGFCAHEALHPAFKHTLRRENRNPRLYYKAADFVINPILLNAGFELPGHPLVNWDWYGKTTEEIYEILLKEQQEREQRIREKIEELKNQADNSGDESENGEGEDKDESENEGESEDDDGQSEDDDGQNNEDQDDNDQIDDDLDEDEDQDDDNQLDDDFSQNLPDDIQQDLEELKKKLKELPEDLQQELQDDFDDFGGVKDQKNEDGSNLSPAEKKQEEEDWNISVLQAEQLQKQCGDLPLGLERLVEDLKRPPLDPAEVFQQFMALSAKNDYSWARPNRRYIQQGTYLPDLRSEELLKVIFVMDTSGSINEKAVETMAGWLEMVLETFDTKLVVIYCDSQVQGEPEIFTREDLPLKLHPRGFGGTNFKPPFEYVREHNLELDCLVYMTDLWCSGFPDEEPEYPVLWVWVKDNHGGIHKCEPPFGDVVEMEVEVK